MAVPRRSFGAPDAVAADEVNGLVQKNGELESELEESRRELFDALRKVKLLT